MVRDFNTRIAQFPSNIIAGLFSFTRREFFELADAAHALGRCRPVPSVDLRAHRLVLCPTIAPTAVIGFFEQC